MSDQPTTTPEVKPVPPLPESTDTTEVNPTSADTLGVEEPTTTTTTATATEESTTAPPATTDTTTATADTTAETTDTTGTSPKQHGSTLLSNFPNFLKKTFEKKQETTEMEGETTAATETTQDTPTTPPASPEKRLSRTLIDLYHKTVGKSDDHAKKEEHNETTAATATTTTTDEPEQHETAQATADEPASPSKESKEPIMDHLRRFNKFFTKKSTEGTTGDDTEVTPTTDDDHPTEPTDHEETTEDTKPTSLSRRFSKLAQNLTTRIKDKKKTQEGSGEETTQEPIIEQSPITTPEAPVTNNNENILPVHASA